MSDCDNCVFLRILLHQAELMERLATMIAIEQANRKEAKRKVKV